MSMVVYLLVCFSFDLSSHCPSTGRLQQVEQEKNQGRFKGPVVGPIGAFIKVVEGKEDFAKIAEVAIGGGTLDRFIVTNDHDRKVMQSIRTKAGCRQDCGIFQVHETPRFKIPPPPVDGIETVASVLNIPNDIVFNCLVDNARIDSRALARDKQSSEQKLLTRDGRGEMSIRGIIKEVYCMPSGDKWIVKGGSMAAISNDRNMRNTIGADRTAAIAEAKREAEQYQHEVKEMRTMEAKLEGDHTKFQRQWNQAKRAMQQNDATISGLVSKVDEIKLEMESTANITVDTTEFEEDVAQAENAVVSLKESESQLSEQISAYEPQIKDLQNRLDETVVRNSRIMEDMQLAEANLINYIATQTQKKGQVEKKRKKLEQYQEAVAMHQEKCDKLSGERGITLETARKLHFRIMMRKKVAEEKEEGNSQVDLSAEPTQEDIEAIEPIHVKNETGFYQSRIDRMKEKIKDERQRQKLSREDPTVAYEKYIRAKRDLAGKVKRDEEIDKKVAELTLDIKERKKLWRQFRQHLDNKTGVKFDEMLSMNKYAGSLDFDHKDGTLDLCVQKDNAKSESSQTKDVKALRYVSRPTIICRDDSEMSTHSFLFSIFWSTVEESEVTPLCACSWHSAKVSKLLSESLTNLMSFSTLKSAS
jgi:chromosome segregation ATPase